MVHKRRLRRPALPAALNRAAWSFDYSVITGLNGELTDFSDFTFVFKVDIDPTAATNFQVFTMSPGGTGSAGVHWTNQFGDVVVDDNAFWARSLRIPGIWRSMMSITSRRELSPTIQPSAPGSSTSSYKPLMALTR